MSDEYRHITVESRDDVVVITVLDRTIDDWDQSESIRKEMVDAYTLSATDKVVVDMQNIDYMSSVGYGPFLSLKSRVSQTDGNLMLCGMSQTVEKVFHVTRLVISPRSKGSVFEACADVGEAVRELNSRS